MKEGRKEGRKGRMKEGKEGRMKEEGSLKDCAE